MRLVLVRKEVAIALDRRIEVLVGGVVHPATRLVVGDLRDQHRRVLLRRSRKHAIDLLDRAPNRNRRRRAAVGDALAKGSDLLVDQDWIPRVAREELLETLGRVRLLVLRDQHRHRLDAPDVIDGELIELALLGFESIARDEHEHVAGDHLLGLEVVAADRLGL